MIQKQLFPLIESFRGMRVTVVGDAILDSYLHARPRQLCREAPVPSVAVEGRSDAPGGAANTAVNAAALGADVRFISVIGDDRNGEILSSLLERDGISALRLVRTKARGTLTKTRIIASSQMLVRFDEGSTGPIGHKEESRLVAGMREAVAESDAVIVSDYGYGLLTPEVIRALSRLKSEFDTTLVADSRSLSRLKSIPPTAVKPNCEEALALLRISRFPPSEMRPRLSGYGGRLLSLTGARICAVTLDRDGALIFEKGLPAYRTYSHTVTGVRATGAGDTFTAALALALSAGAGTQEAAEIASAAAGVVTSKEVTASCSAEELRARLSAGSKFIPDLECLSALCSFYRRQDKRVVFTNGCFDVLRKSHIIHLNRSKELGDKLIVGVNSDRGVTRIRGAGRPASPLEDRIQVLAALSCVDHIAVFDEDTSETLIRTIRPHIFTKGGNYSRSSLPEAPILESLGTKISILPLFEDVPARLPTAQTDEGEPL